MCEAVDILHGPRRRASARRKLAHFTAMFASILF